MAYLLLKGLISGLVVVLVSEFAKRSPAVGGLLASLPLVSVLAMIWLWRDTGDAGRIASHATSTFWFVLPSLPMFLLVPVLLRRGAPFWPSLAAGCLLTVALYVAFVAAAPRLGFKL